MATWSLLTEYLGGIPDSVTLDWKELDAIVGGIPASASDHRAWWSGDRPHVRAWKSAGFEISNLRMGTQVTFVRTRSSSKAPSSNALPKSISTATPHTEVTEEAGANTDIILVSCVKTKLPVAAKAKDLYTSALFRKASTYVKRKGIAWYILSAEHGLVSPEQWLEPYERYLPNETSSYREAWGAKVVDDLERIEGPLQGKVIEIHAGSVYVNVIASRLRARGAVIREPLNGLPMGKRLQWYDRNLAMLS